MGQNGNGALRQTILVGDRYPLLADAAATLLGEIGFSIVAVVHDTAGAAAAMRQHRPDIAVIDCELDAIGQLHELRAGRATTRLVMTCVDLHPGPLVAAIDLRIDGLVLKTSASETLRQCVATVATGRQWLDPAAMRVVLEEMTARAVAPAASLTRRERDVAQLVATGQRNRAIAGRLGISEGTVKMHLHNVYAKLGLESRTQLAMEMRSAA